MPTRRIPQPRLRRSAAALAACCALLASCGTDPGPQVPAARQVSADGRPNLILVSIDTLRADRLGAYGHDRDTSPTLDALSKRGLLFENAFSTAPWTLLSHLSMLTGLYVDQHGVRDGEHGLSLETVTLAERLSEAGYDTAGFYFESWIHPRYGFARGFDVFAPHGDVVEAEAHLDEYFIDRDSEQPLFLFLHLFDVHIPSLNRPEALLYEPPDEYARRYRADAPDVFAPGDAAAFWNLEKRATEDQYDAIRALYDGGIRYTDDRLAVLLESWRASGLLDNALLVVTSDHGEGLGLRRGKLPGHGGLFQEGLRVPMIVTLPDGSRAGERLDHAVSTIDLAPTLLRAAGAAAAELPGFDLLAGPRPPGELIRARNADLLAVIRWPQKLVGRSEGFAPVEDRSGWNERLDLDPTGSELLLAEDDPQAFRELRENLNQAITAELAAPDAIAHTPQPVRELDGLEADRLRALGYAEETDH